MEKRQWIGEALRLHFDEKLTRLAVSHHLKLSDSTLYDFFQRFRKYNLPWPLPNGVTMNKLERILYPGKKAKKTRPCRSSGSNRDRRPNFSVEFKRHLVEQSMQPGVNVAQLAREHGINDNLLFNWRRQYLHKQKKEVPTPPVMLMPVEISPQHDIIELTPLQPVVSEKDAALCQVTEPSYDNPLSCEVALPGGTLRLQGAVTPVLLRVLLNELKGSQ